MNFFSSLFRVLVKTPARKLLTSGADWANRPGIRALKLRVAYAMNELGVRLIIWGRTVVRSMYSDFQGERFGTDWLRLHYQVDRELRKQRETYAHYKYASGYPYQGFFTAGIFGLRGTEERFQQYGLRELIRPEDVILDIGCNCGFMAVYTAYRTGCRATGIDINPHMINIGRYCAEFLGLSDRVQLVAGRFQEWTPPEKYSVIFSFASHWTDDEQHRPDFDAYLGRLHDLLKDRGRLVFESHTGDVDNQEFYRNLERQRARFAWEGSRRLDSNRRELFIMRKRGGESSPA